MKLTRLHRGYAYTHLSSVGKPSHLCRNRLFQLDAEWLDIFQCPFKRWTRLLSNVGQDFCQTLDKTFVKRWTRPLSNVGQDLYQTCKIPFSSVRQHPLHILDNNIDKRLKTPLSNYDLQIPISFISMRYLLFLMDKQ